MENVKIIYIKLVKRMNAKVHGRGEDDFSALRLMSFYILLSCLRDHNKANTTVVVVVGEKKNECETDAGAKWRKEDEQHTSLYTW